jgi:hypothetical protein
VVITDLERVADYYEERTLEAFKKAKTKTRNKNEYTAIPQNILVANILQINKLSIEPGLK